MCAFQLSGSPERPFLLVHAKAAVGPRISGAFWHIRYAHLPENAEKKFWLEERNCLNHFFRAAVYGNHLSLYLHSQVRGVAQSG